MQRFYQVSLSLCILFILPSVVFLQSAIPTMEVAGISKSRLDRYADFLQNEINDGKIAGAVSLIYRKGEMVHNQAWGYQSLDSREPMSTDQIFYIQSMTKPIISVAFMMLYEEGHFLLTDPVLKYLPAFDCRLPSKRIPPYHRKVYQYGYMKIDKKKVLNATLI